MSDNRSYPTIIIPKQLFSVIINELEMHHGWTLNRGHDEYAEEIRGLINTLESYDTSPTTKMEVKE